MSQVGSFPGGGFPFDLHSQAGVMAVLVAVRSSALSPAQKNELRDLVFQYSNGGGDPSVRIALEQKITAYGLTPVATKAAAPKAPPPPVRPYGSTRPAPSFALVTAVPAAASRPLVAPPPAPAVAVPPQVSVAPVTPPPAAPAPVVTPPPPPVVETPSVVATPVATPVASAPFPAPVTAPAPAVVATPVVTAPVSLQPAAVHLERIRAIKYVVNQKVGNPVNLVDIDNAVGREYMMALLEAMKKVSGGMPGELETAMARLEAAFARVEQAVAAHEAAKGAAPALTPEAPGPVVPEPVAPPAPPVSVPSMVPEAVSVPETPVAPPPPASVPVEPSTPSPQSAPHPPSPVAEVTADNRWGASSDSSSPSSVVPPPSAPLFKAASLADDPAPLLTPSVLPDAASVNTTSANGDPLFTKEVDDGLEQLLLEWPIFKKSGLFGTGPKGRQHPLFKELAPLTVPIILAGRYDSATDEIRQSVTDYMNGWRYEQGLVYDNAETFERYLRRVIRHIIDLQKKRP